MHAIFACPGEQSQARIALVPGALARTPSLPRSLVPSFPCSLPYTYTAGIKFCS
jgi:hypothetical protein